MAESKVAILLPAMKDSQNVCSFHVHLSDPMPFYAMLTDMGKYRVEMVSDSTVLF